MKKISLTLFALLMMSLTINGEIVNSWTSGACTCTLTDNGTFTVSGNGAMADYDDDNNKAPWNGYSKNILSAVIGDGVTSIGSSAFNECVKISSISVSSSVTRIKLGAFAGCRNLSEVNFADGSRLKTIEPYAFSYCEKLPSITIPDSVISIGYEAFSVCKNLTSIILGNSLMTIGDQAFKDVTNLTSITFGNSVTSIGIEAFSGTGITSITIPASVTRIGSCAFLECKNLSEVNFADGSRLKTIEPYAFSGTGITSITIPASVTEIGEEAFKQLKLTSVTFSEGIHLAKMGREAFCQCADMTTISFPETGTINIGEYAFAASSIKELTIPASVQSIGLFAFTVCKDLTSVTIGSGLTEISDYVFDDCPRISTIVVNGNSNFDSRDNCNAIIRTSTNTLLVGCKNTVIPDNVTSIGNGAFACSEIRSMLIPSSVTYIGEGAFAMCYDLTSIEIPNSVKTIGKMAFQACDKMISVTIGSGVTSIEEGAFSSCRELASVICLRETPPTLGAYNFPSLYSNIIIYVPNETAVSKYQAASGWNELIRDEVSVIQTLQPFKLAVGECGWASMYLSYNVTVPEGATAYYASSANDGLVTLKPITAGNIIPASTGVLVNAAEGSYNFAYNATPTDHATNLFKGVMADTPCPANEDYVLDVANTKTAGTPILAINTDTTLEANKAYLPKSVVPEGNIRLVFDEPTSIGRLTPTLSEGKGVMYNLNGMRVNDNYKGVVISNGKKYILK